jgi:hypothetical protein
MAEKPVPVGIRLPPEKKAKLDLAAAERGIYIYQLLEEMIDKFFTDEEAKGPGAEVPTKYRPTMKKLAEILSSGDGPVIRAAVANVEVFYDRLRPAGHKGR